MPLVETNGLTKRYGGFTAVDGLDLRLEEGEVYGFLGPNGSGKSTTILMLLGLTEPSAGSARVLGHDPSREPLAVKRHVGYLPENVGFYGDMTGRENLRYTADLNRLPREAAARRVDELLDMVELDNAKDQPVGQYSRGMRQRLGLADVLLKDPKLVVLDDPTLGLDPMGIQWLLGIIEEMSKRRHITVLLSSHQLQEVQRVCDRVGIMSHGKLVLEDTVTALTARESGAYHVTMETRGAGAQLAAALRAVPGVTDCQVEGHQVSVQADRDVRAEVTAGALAAGAQVLEVRGTNRTLEDIYLRYFQEAK